MKFITSALMLSFLFTVACAQKQKSGDIVETKVSEKQEEKAKKTEIADRAFKCVVNKDTRLVEFDSDKQRCEIHYTKFGEKMQVAWAESTPTICSDVYEKIRTNIESKGFKCEALNETADTKKEEPKTEAKRESASLKQ